MGDILSHVQQVALCPDNVRWQRRKNTVQKRRLVYPNVYGITLTNP